MNNFFLKLSFVCGILEAILIILFQFISSYLLRNPIYSIVFWLLVYIAFIFFLFGFYKIAKEYDKTFLRVILIIIIIYQILGLLGSISHDVHNILFGTAPISDLRPGALYITFLILGFIGALTNGSIANLFLGILLALFGAGLINTRYIIKYARVTGIFNVLDGGIKVILSLFVIFVKIYTYTNPILRIKLSNFLSGIPFIVGSTIFDILPYIFGTLLIYYELKKNKKMSS